MQETWVQFLGQEDPLEKEMATPGPRAGSGTPATTQCARSGRAHRGLRAGSTRGRGHSQPRLGSAPGERPAGTQARLQQLLWTLGPATPLSSALPGTCVTPQLTQPPGARPGRPGTRDGRVPWEVGSPRAQVGSLALGTTEKVFHVIPGLA